MCTCNCGHMDGLGLTTAIQVNPKTDSLTINATERSSEEGRSSLQFIKKVRFDLTNRNRLRSSLDGRRNDRYFAVLCGCRENSRRALNHRGIPRRDWLRSIYILWRWISRAFVGVTNYLDQVPDWGRYGSNWGHEGIHHCSPERYISQPP